MTYSKDKIHIVIPVFNRREVTCACLRMLSPLIEAGWKVVVVDDNSTDGTVATVRKKFPKVSVLDGSGNLFWTGAMEKGMRHAVREDTECCIWLNDDVTIDHQAVVSVMERAMAGSCVVSAQGKIDLEGTSFWYFPASQKTTWGIENTPVDGTWSDPYKVDACRGNLVAFPREIIDAIGFPDGKNIPHVAGDTDYTLRATAAGFDCLVDPGAVFLEEENIKTDNRSWLLDDTPVGEIFRKALTKRGSMYPRMVFAFRCRHWGLRGFLQASAKVCKLLGILLLKKIAPKSFLHTVFASRSHAYKVYADRDL